MEVENFIKNWLRFAPLRYGDRSRKNDLSQTDVSARPVTVKMEDP